MIYYISVEHVSFCTEGGTVLTLGEGDTGQLGLGPDIMERTKPGKVAIDNPVIQICAGGMHTVCLTDKGEVSITQHIP
jgi:regulator of chromosome condensation